MKLDKSVASLKYVNIFQEFLRGRVYIYALKNWKICHCFYAKNTLNLRKQVWIIIKMT